MLSGRSDIALNSDGRDQARKLAIRLAGMSPRNIYTSPRKRARETATIVADVLKLEPLSVDAYDEIDFGEWTGRSFAELQADKRWHRWNANRGRAATPAGDTMENVTARASHHLETRDGDGTILCVSHCDVIRGLVAHYLGLDADRVLAFDIDPASITTIEFCQGAARVIAVNERLP